MYSIISDIQKGKNKDFVATKEVEWLQSWQALTISLQNKNANNMAESFLVDLNS